MGVNVFGVICARGVMLAAVEVGEDSNVGVGDLNPTRVGVGVKVEVDRTGVGVGRGVNVSVAMTICVGVSAGAGEHDPIEEARVTIMNKGRKMILFMVGVWGCIL